MSIDPAIYKVFEALQTNGWRGDPEELATALRKINHGLPAQDEFCLLASWLGRCRLIHGLNQLQYPPESSTKYRVPDLVAVFETSGGDIPVLIEVKSKAASKLTWRPDYYEPLVKYGELLRMPVLVAWKETRTRMWSLVDISLFTKENVNYKITFSDAMKNSLMGVLAGDFLIQFTPGFGLHIVMRKLSGKTDGSVPVRIEEAYFLSPTGKRFTTLNGGLWPFFLTLDVQDDTEETKSHYHQSFVVREEAGSQFAHRGFPALFISDGSKPWRKRLEEHSFSVRAEELQEAAREAYQYGATAGIMHVFPQTMPSFLDAC